MIKSRAASSPDLVPSSDADRRADESSTEEESATAKVRLLYKLVKSHEDAFRKGSAAVAGRKSPNSISGILCVLDDIRFELEKSHAMALRREAELRRCNTELRGGSGSGSVGCHGCHHQGVAAVEENHRLRKELSATMAARKSLERMFSSLGKEKEIMASELQRKVRDLHDMEEHISDLRAQNEMLRQKVQLCAAEHKDKAENDHTGAVAACEKSLHDRNKALSEQLLKAIDGYRSLKRKLREAQEEKMGMQAMVAEVAARVVGSLGRVREFCREAAAVAGGGHMADEISSIERMFSGLQDSMSPSAIAGFGKGKKAECSKPRVSATQEGKP